LNCICTSLPLYLWNIYLHPLPLPLPFPLPSSLHPYILLHPSIHLTPYTFTSNLHFLINNVWYEYRIYLVNGLQNNKLTKAKGALGGLTDTVGKTGKGLTDTVSGVGKTAGDTVGSATKGVSDTTKGMLSSYPTFAKRCLVEDADTGSG
jgi:hypothetical protein